MVLAKSDAASQSDSDQAPPPPRKWASDADLLARLRTENGTSMKDSAKWQKAFPEAKQTRQGKPKEQASATTQQMDSPKLKQIERVRGGRQNRQEKK